MLKNCPSCGRPIDFEEKYARILSCNYCNSILEFGTGELTKVGEQSEFIEFPSIFSVGNYTNFKGRELYVKGQLRYEYDGGFFDKFYVTDSKNYFYVKEDDGLYTLEDDGNWINSNEGLIDKEVGVTFNLLGNDIFVQETGVFRLVNIRGFIDTYLIIGKDYEYLTGINNGKVINFEKLSGENKIRLIKEVL